MSRQETKDIKKRQILAGALKIFSQKGFHAASTKEIAAESGVAEGLIFYYFGDKRKLLLEIVRQFTFLQQLQADAGAAQSMGLSLEETLVEYGLNYLHFLQENIDYLMLIWSPELVRDEAVSQEVRQLIERIGITGAQWFKPAMAERTWNEAAFRVALTTLHSSLLVYYMMNARFGAETLGFKDESYVRQLARLLLQGLENSSIDASAQ
ncbi:TetR/AcrR family transcriptional regulator [Paenibacillus donghaensis]|uniref:TetR/AcrR family transcriptional regulator n=1 Tax=Paenibacillus donghaensis TaxID=414771 RepID=UPI001FE5A945|nr:TetR/AcrR family transcriptional regulator [Paenibacillus donghaensis]